MAAGAAAEPSLDTSTVTWAKAPTVTSTGSMAMSSTLRLGRGTSSRNSVLLASLLVSFISMTSSLASAVSTSVLLPGFRSSVVTLNSM